MRRVRLLGFIFALIAGATVPSTAFAAAAVTDGSPTADSTGVAQTNAQNGIKTSQQKLQNLQTTQTAQQIKTAGDSCSKAIEDGKNACMESTSPFMQQMSSALPGMLAGVMGAAGKDKCNLMAQGMKMLQGLQGNYNSDCQAKKVACTKACADAGTKVSQAQSSGCTTEAQSLQNPSAAQSCQQAAQDNQSSISKGVDACNALQAKADAGQANKDQLQQGQDNAQQCAADEAQDCTQNPDQASCQKAIDCNAPGAATKYPQCICQLSPSKCNGSSSSASNPSTGDSNAADAGSGANLGSNTPAADAVDGGNHPAAAGGGLPGAPGGDSGGGLKGGSGADKDKLAKDKPKADVLGGDTGGGGGSRAGGPSDPYDHGPNAALAKQIERKVAEDKVKNQFTGSYGSSNWEKVNVISRENAPKLIPDRK